MEYTINSQSSYGEEEETVVALPQGVKDCAKSIVDRVYEIDRFQRIVDLFEVTGQNVKLVTDDVGDTVPKGTFLRYMFALPTSGAYRSEMTEDKTRVFEKEYDIPLSRNLHCKLSSEWNSKELQEGSKGSSNYLKALLEIVRKHYADYFEIHEEGNGYVLHVKKKNSFLLKDLPEAFDAAYARRFITSLLAKPFVILTGNSGTGKTRIAKQVAEYLEVFDENGEKNWLIVPVGADWTDNTRVLGFYNPLADNGAGKYEKTGILKLLERANAHPHVPYFLILDEMNLSHVERYFADFLSHMEIPDNFFELDGYRGRDGETEGRLPYPNNLFVVGTVNIDETTYMFSPKVLDRANVLEFKPNRETVLDAFSQTTCSASVYVAKPGVAEAFLRLANEIRGGIHTLDEGQMRRVRDTFAKIYDIAEKRGYEFAYRTVGEIRRYLDASRVLSETWGDAELYRAMDEQLLQKILPKLHGNRKEIGGMLGEMEELCKTTERQLLLSAKKLEQMKGKLDAVQYASFI